MISKYTEHLGIISCTTTCMSQAISKYTEQYGIISCTATCKLPRPGGYGERVRLVTWWLQVRSPIEATFLSGVSSPLTSAKHVRKVVGGFGKKLCYYWCERTRKHMCFTDRHDMTLAVKVAFKTTNQPATCMSQVISKHTEHYGIISCTTICRFRKNTSVLHSQLGPSLCRACTLFHI